MGFGSIKNKVTNKLFSYESLMYEQELALNNPQELICHKTQPNKRTLMQRDL